MKHSLMSVAAFATAALLSCRATEQDPSAGELTAVESAPTAQARETCEAAVGVPVTGRGIWPAGLPAALGSGAYSYSGGRTRVEFSSVPHGAVFPGEFDWTTVDVHWYPPLIRKGLAGPIIVLRGRMTHPGPKGNAVAVEWLQGVTVLLARQPGTEPDWATGVDEDETAFHQVLVTPQGEFAVPFHPWEIRRAVDETLPFRVALTISHFHSEKVALWRLNDPLLPQSLATVKIPGSVRLHETDQALAAVGEVAGAHFNPAVLVRAVNRLHALGKERALEELSGYLDLCEMPFMNAEEPFREDADIDRLRNYSFGPWSRSAYNPSGDGRATIGL